MARFRCSQPRRLLLGIVLSVLAACSTPAGEAVTPVVGDTPTPAATPTLTAEQLAKIDPELLAAIELEEAEPGKGIQAAAEKYQIEPDGRITLRIRFDPNVIRVEYDPSGVITHMHIPGAEGTRVVVTLTPLPGVPVGEQPAGQLIVRHGGQPVKALSFMNAVRILIPIQGIRGLAREEAVTEIIPSSNKPIELDEPIKIVPVP